MYYSLSGNAIQGTDYTINGTPGEIVIPAGETTGSVTLHVLGNSSRNKKRKATMTLQPGTGYHLAAKKKFRKATVTIRKD